MHHSHCDLVLSGIQRPQKRRLIQHLHRFPIEHIKPSVSAVQSQIIEAPYFCIIGKDIPQRLLISLPDRIVLLHGTHLRQPKLDRCLKMHGNPLIHSRHIERSDLVDRRGALLTHIKRQETEDNNTEDRHTGKTDLQKSYGPFIHHISPP